MKRPNLNFLVDFVAFAACIFLLSTGLIMYFVLPPGHGHLELWGMNRHGWGDIHFWSAVAFILIIAIHLVLHWKWIISKVKGRVKSSEKISARTILFATGVSIIILISISPFFSPVNDTGAEKNHSEHIEVTFDGE